LIVDSQSLKAASTVGKDSRGYDAGKKINGRQRHIVVDTLGLPMMITVNARDEIITRDLLWRLRLTHPRCSSSASVVGACSNRSLRPTSWVASTVIWGVLAGDPLGLVPREHDQSLTRNRLRLWHTMIQPRPTA
jgi:hypothetical protein